MRKGILAMALAAAVAAGSGAASAAAADGVGSHAGAAGEYTVRVAVNAPSTAAPAALSATINSIMSDRRYGSELERMMAINDAVMEYMMGRSFAPAGGDFFRPPHGVFVSHDFFDMAERMERMMQSAGFAWPYVESDWDLRAWPNQGTGRRAPVIEIPAEETDI